jgi:hypothetical protein
MFMDSNNKSELILARYVNKCWLTSPLRQNFHLPNISPYEKLDRKFGGLVADPWGK